MEPSRSSFGDQHVAQNAHDETQEEVVGYYPTKQVDGYRNEERHLPPPILTILSIA